MAAESGRLLAGQGQGKRGKASQMKSPEKKKRKSNTQKKPQEVNNMSALSTDKKPLVDYGVQIRFIKDLHDTGGGYPEKSRGGSNPATPPSNKYGVAVRVQGISGQPYVVLKDGEKGDSYGVQLKSQAPSPTASTSCSGPPSPYNSLPKGWEGSDPYANPYASSSSALRNATKSPSSPDSPVENEVADAFRSPFKRPPGDGQAGSYQGEIEPEAVNKPQAERTMVAELRPKPAPPPPPTNEDRGWPSGEGLNEAGLKPVNLNGFGSRGLKQNGTAGPAAVGSLGRYGGKKLSQDSSSFASESFPEPPPAEEKDEPVPAIDSNSLGPINKLINKFNSSAPDSAAPQQTRGRNGARQRLKFEERKRSRSLDARKDNRPEVSPPSPTPNPYAAPLSPFSSPSSTSSSLTSSSHAPESSSSSSLGRNPAASVAKVTTPHTAPKPSRQSPGNFVAKDTPPAIPKKPEFPAVPRNQNQSPDFGDGDAAQAKQAIYNILKAGTSESDASIKRKVNLLYETSHSVKKESDGIQKWEENWNDNVKLQEKLNRNLMELQQAHDELAELRMAREGAESRVRQQEDQLAGLQEELRRVSETSPHADSLQTDVRSLQAELAEAAVLRQRQDETLRQRERELTALKGALKDEVECHDQEVEALREQYSQDMDKLRRTMEQVTQSQGQIEEERQRVNASIVSLEEELEGCRDQGEQWKNLLEATTEELDTTKQELMKSRLEKEEFEGELKDLQDSLLAMKKQMPGFDDEHSYAEDLRRCHDDLKSARQELDRLNAELDKKNEETEALRRAGEEREAELQAEVDRVKEQAQKDKEEMERAVEKMKESLKNSADQGTNQELQEANTRLRERLARMRIHSSTPLASDSEEALEDENRSLKSQLEEAKRAASRLAKERDELGRRLEERDMERDALRRGKNDLEEQKRLLDRALDKINKEMELMMAESRQSVVTLQTQLDEYRERSRKDLMDAQRNSKDRLAELQRAQGGLKTLQEEVSRLKKDLLVCGEERDSAQLERDLLSSRLKHLESELDAEKNSHGERAREVRGLEDKIKTLEIELDEERSSVELLNDRIARSREQIDQLRADLLQERSARHDLEMDKSSLERQVKELKCRVADMEGQSRPSTGIALLESKVQELEERLHSEEREKASIQAAHRRTERKLKEVNATLDQERSQHAEQRDQLSLRVKALKRQVDESEGEVERLEGVRRKVLRDLEEQQELQEALQAKVTALESEMKRKGQQTRRSVLGSSNLSSEDEDGFYDGNSITSILTESHLQTTNC